MVAMVTFNQTQTAQQRGAAVYLCWETSHFPTFIKTLRVVCVWTGRLGGESPHVQETQVEAGRS